MTFKEEIELQLRDNKVLSYEILSQLKDKNYFSGRSKEIGDTVLFGMLDEAYVNEQEVSIRLITFHEEELGVLYEQNPTHYTKTKSNKLPILKRVENGN